MRRERIIELPKLVDRRGNLSFVEAENHIPFSITRVYWIYDIPGGEYRGGHAFRKQHEVIVALSGSFDVILNNGEEEHRYTLNRSYNALYVPNMMWRELENFSTNAVCLVISSDGYDANDYIRDYNEFKNLVSMGIPDTLTKKKREKYMPPNQYNTVFDCSLIELPVICNQAGNITSVQGFQHLPFDIKRVFYIYDIPSGAERGMHAHKRCHEILIAVSGSFEVELDDGINKKTVLLNRPMTGLYIPPGVWAVEKEYSAGAVCLVLASDIYNTEDYINTYAEFQKYRADGNKAI